MLKVEKLNKKYGSLPALKNVSFELKPGIYGLLGPNGAGKSTLMNIITLGLNPDSGSIMWNNESIYKSGIKYREILGFMPQQQGLYEGFTGFEFLNYMAVLKGIDRKSIKTEINRVSELTNMTGLLSRKISGYSGGMKQRLLLSSAVMGSPELIILDEPTAGLDPKERIRTRELIKSAAEGRTVIVATHIVSDIETVADEIMLMKNGELIKKDKYKDLCENYGQGRGLEGVYMHFFLTGNNIMSVKFELKKIFYSRFFPAVLIIAVLLNLFILYENGAPEEKAMQYNTYDEFVDSVQAKAEKTLSVSVFSDELSEFSKKNIIKTAEDFEKMRGIEISPDINTGIKIILNPGISDIFILLLLIVAGLALITDEKEKRLFHLIRSTARGTAGTIISKLSALLICCVVINALISGSAAVYAYINYGFGDVFRSIQSVPDMLTAYLRLNILQFLSVLFILKTAGIFILGVIVLFLCLITSRAITMLVSVVLLSGSSFFMTFIPETSVSGFFRYINFYSLLNPYRIFGSYVNLNIFGLPVSVNAVFTVFLIAMLILSLSAVIIYFIKKRPLENRDKRNVSLFSHNKIRCGIAYFECKKLLSINKAAAIILAFTLLQTYNVYKQESFMSSDEYAYKYYTEMLIGPLTGEKEELIISEKEKLSYAEQQLKIINEQRRDNQLSMQEFIEKQKQYSGIIEKSDVFSRVYEKYLHVKNHPGAEFIYDTGYERLFSISDENFSLFNSLLLLTVFALCLCSIYSVEYKTQAYRLLCTTKYGRDRTRRIKYGLSIALSLVIFIIAYAPELIFTGRFYGFPELKGQLLSIPGLSGCGGLPIWAGILIHYVFRLLAVFLLVPVIAAISLKTKNNIITAIIFSVIFVLPGAVYYFSDIKPVLYLSFFNLFSGSMLAEGFVYLIQFAVLTAASYISARYIYRRAIS